MITSSFPVSCTGEITDLLVTVAAVTAGSYCIFSMELQSTVLAFFPLSLITALWGIDTLLSFFFSSCLFILQIRASILKILRSLSLGSCFSYVILPLRLYKDTSSKPSTIYIGHLEYNFNVIEMCWWPGKGSPTAFLPQKYVFWSVQFILVYILKN